MATNPKPTTSVYLITSQEPCSATLAQGANVITWEALTEGGQTTVIVPAEATLELSSPSALLSPLPFEGALAVGNGGSGGRGTHTAGITPVPAEGQTPVVELAHEAWYELNARTESCAITPSAKATVVQAHLIITPADTMPSGWLTATDGAVVRWPFGEIAMPAGWSYIITLVQVGKVIQANALPVDLSTPAA